MKKNINRRNFLKKSIAASTGAALALSLEEKALLAKDEYKPAVKPSKDSSGSLPMAKLGKLKVSRLICGGNLISGYAHSRDLRYVSSLVKAYHTDEKIMETLQLCEENGVNAFLSDPRPHPMRVINKYWKERGGTMLWIAEGHPKVKDIKTNLKKSIDNGASAIYVQGGVGDKWVKAGRVDLIGEAVEFIKENGLVAGVGGHSLEVPMACEKARIKCDFYMKTLHHSNYWSATPPEERVEFNVDSNAATDHDNIWSICPEKTAEFMKTVEKPWIAYKVLAAGGIHPRSGFKYAFKNGVDFICVGMFDFQVLEDIMIAKKALSDVLEKGRERPWRA